jgi:DNA replication protein DnaC
MLHARLADWRGGSWNDKTRIQQRLNAKHAVEQAVTQRHGLYTFYGDFGSGKTHALAVACNELRAELMETFYAPMPSILAHLRSLYGTKQDSSTFWDRLLDIPVLALDEVTRINTTDWAREMLFVLVDTRYRRRASHLTLFATNDDPRQSLPASETFGYLFSRMRQGKVIELRGDVREVAL